MWWITTPKHTGMVTCVRDHMSLNSEFLVMLTFIYTWLSVVNSCHLTSHVSAKVIHLHGKILLENVPRKSEPTKNFKNVPTAFGKHVIKISIRSPKNNAVDQWSPNFFVTANQSTVREFYHGLVVIIHDGCYFSTTVVSLNHQIRPARLCAR